MADLIGFDFTREDTTPQFPLGACRMEFGGSSATVPAPAGIWQYVRNSGGGSAGHAYSITPETFVSAKLATSTTDAGKAVGWGHAAFTTLYYHWIWRGLGTFEAIIDDADTTGAMSSPKTTAGVCSSSSDAGSQLFIPRALVVDTGVTATRVTIWVPGIAVLAP